MSSVSSAAFGRTAFIGSAIHGFVRAPNRVRVRLEFGAVIVVATAMLMLTGGARSTYSNNYILLANAILHGRLWIDWPGRIIDAAFFNGQHYVIDGPFPALLAIPMVLAFGQAANQTTIAIAGGIIATALAWWLLYRLDVPWQPRLWLTLFMFAGTDLWWCAQLGDVQFLAHVAAVCCTLAALIEVLVGKKRGWLVAIYAVAAVESRYALLMAVPMYLWLLRGHARETFIAVLWFGLVGWMVYNVTRFGTPYDPSHALFYAQDPAAGVAAGAPPGSPLALRYIPYELYSFFLRAPTLIDGGMNSSKWPFIGCDPQGIALTFTSPALALAFRCQRSWLMAGLWVTVALVAVPNILFYTNGWWQFGMRHALDFEPFLLVLMALGVRQYGMPRWGSALCAYSAIVGACGVWWWNATYRTGN